MSNPGKASKSKGRAKGSGKVTVSKSGKSNPVWKDCSHIFK